jgi:AI-2E family transporter
MREALPQTDEIAGKVGAAAATVGNIILKSTLGIVGGVLSVALALLLLVFVLANPQPLVAGYLALAPDRYHGQAYRTLARMIRQMQAWARAVAINGCITGFSIGMGLWLIGIQPALMFGVFAFVGEFLPNIGVHCVDSGAVCCVKLGPNQVLAGARAHHSGLSGRIELSRARCPREGDAATPGEYSFLHRGNGELVWPARRNSSRASSGAGADCHR